MSEGNEEAYENEDEIDYFPDSDYVDSVDNEVCVCRGGGLRLE